MSKNIITRFDEAELEQINAELRRTSPQEIIQWAVRRFSPELALASSFGGISGMVLLDLTLKISKDLKVFFLDTGFLFPETYALIGEVEKRYGIKVEGYKSPLTPEAQAAQLGEALWQSDPDKCCEIRKIQPNREALVGMQAWITGLRRDQTSFRSDLQPVEWDDKFNLYKVNPLWDWTEDMVWTYIRAEEILYNPLHDKGYASIGCTHCTRPVAEGEDSRAGRWSGSGKTECGLHYATRKNKN